ncbi:MAG: transposase, partial [Vicinamibacterales bacterium]
MGRAARLDAPPHVVPVRAGILAIDDTGFPQQGTQSAGVQRQYCVALGKIGNCQVAVSTALIADGRTWPLAFDLYVPVPWTEDAEVTGHRLSRRRC